jgi:hypothetical protein
MKKIKRAEDHLREIKEQLNNVNQLKKKVALVKIRNNKKNMSGSMKNTEILTKNFRQWTMTLFSFDYYKVRVFGFIYKLTK